jgi:hypothetical protein
MNVFISYSSRDRGDALKIRRLLEEHDCVVWLDAFDINAAANLEEQLYSNITRADLFCLLLSPTSVASEWVAKEIDEAIRQRASRKLGILPVLLRPCNIPAALQNLAAFRVHEVAEGYQGLDDEAVCLQFVRRVFGAATVEDVRLDEAMRKSLAGLAVQQEAAKAMPQLARALDAVRSAPFRDVQIGIDARVFEGQIYDEHPFVLELRLVLNPLFTAPLSLFFARFREGHTWPPAFGFDEPPYTRFRDDQPRLDCKVKWYDRVEDAEPVIDGTELGMPLAGFSVQFDGSTLRPDAAPGNRLTPTIPPLPVAYEIPSLQKLIEDRCQFEVILHRIDSEQAEPVNPRETDIALELAGRVGEDKLDVTLFKMPNTEIEKVLLAGDYLSHIVNPIERAATLALYSKPESRDVEARVRIHELRLSLPKIDWDEDRRLVARLIDAKSTLFAFRRRQIKILDWDDVPGTGAESLRAFLDSDFESQDFFAYLVFDEPEEIERAEIVKTPDDRIEVRAPGRTLRITPVPEEFRAEVTAVDGAFAGSTLHNFMLLTTKSRRSLFLSNQMDVLYGCLAVLDLVGPIVFEGRPLFTDGHLFQKASAHLFGHLVSQKFWPRAKEMAQYGVDADRAMAAQDPKEPQYIRWEAEAQERLGAAETKLGNAKAATGAFARSLQLYRDLYTALPNGSRMADLIGSLERAVKRSPAKSRATQSSGVKAELSALQKLRQKIESFAEIAGLRSGSVPADILGQMAGALTVSHGSGTRTDADYSGPYTSTYLTPRADLDPAAWKTFDRLLRAAGYEWTKTYVGGKKGCDRKWEKWIPTP